MNIEIFTNQVAGGWHPNDLTSFLGGNEESVVLLAEAWARAKHHVTVYTTLRETPTQRETRLWNGVNWKQISEFNLQGDHDVLITMKDRQPWFRGADARIKIHWCNDIEQPWSTGTINHVDKIVILGTYMKDRMPWIPNNKLQIIPLAMDMRPFRNGDFVRDENLAVYATSPDRGLVTLLEDWHHIKKFRPELKLFVTYGWKNLETMGGGPGRDLAARLQQMLKQPDIRAEQLSSKDMVAMLRTAKYYVHPLNRPDSDLFGFGMMKARAAGCTLVVPSVANNGFRDMADKYIPYRKWITGNDEEKVNPLCRAEPISWEKVLRQWRPLLEGAGTQLGI